MRDIVECLDNVIPEHVIHIYKCKTVLGTLLKEGTEYYSVVVRKDDAREAFVSNPCINKRVAKDCAKQWAKKAKLI